MGIRINQNVFSLYVNRNLERVTANLSKSIERLSSGEKINSAGDDPAGLANSNALTAKIQGLQRTQLNANQGLNLLSVAESSLGSQNEILQRLRELAVQASTETISDDDRQLIQDEVDELLSELDRIATDANYNGKNLLDGTFQDQRLQIGTCSDQSIPISLADSRTSALGRVATVTGSSSVNATSIAGTGDLTINGVTIPASVLDSVSTVNGSASAIAKTKAINEVTYLTGVTATAGASVYSASGATVQNTSLNGTTSSLTINGINIGVLDVSTGDTNNALRARINNLSGQTGVTASLGTGGELVLTAEDGRNIDIQSTGSVADELGLQVADGDISTVAYGSVTLSSADTIQVGGVLGLVGFGAAQTTTFVDPTTAVSNIKMTTQADAETALDSLDVAIQQLLERRSKVGAVEGRLNLAIDDMMMNVENLTASDSRITDADFATETTALTQAQIIQQAGVSILAQANVIPQMALSLLENQ
jgi:flagellin